MTPTPKRPLARIMADRRLGCCCILALVLLFVHFVTLYSQIDVWLCSESIGRSVKNRIARRWFDGFDFRFGALFLLAFVFYILSNCDTYSWNLASGYSYLYC
jgi:hypothetical protein